jgi:aryl-alcohol dehydrogenase-like predicted oxidoreductase
MKLKKAQFGRTECCTSELCLSTSNFARYAAQEESFAILDSFREAGGNFIQTSGICPGVNLGDGFLGMPEELLGRWLQVRRVERASIIVATRIALSRPVIGGLATYTELIRQCAQDSIRRTGCSYLDFLIVEWTEAIVPVDESMSAFEAVIASGEVRYVVPANFPLTDVHEGFSATQRGPGIIPGLQLDYSLAARHALDDGAVSFITERGLGIIARSPLAGGHLAHRRIAAGNGGLRNRGASDRHAAVAAEELWPSLSAIARAVQHSPAQVALSWVLAHPRITSVLVSVSSVDQLHELCAATHLTLSRDDYARLGALTPAALTSAPSPEIDQEELS